MKKMVRVGNRQQNGMSCSCSILARCARKVSEMTRISASHRLRNLKVPDIAQSVMYCNLIINNCN